MARRANHDCLILKTEEAGTYSDTGAPRTQYTTYCGKTSYVRYKMTDIPRHASCPKCSAKWNAGKGGGVTLEKLALPTEGEERVYGYGRWAGIKSAYRVMKDGECYGLVTIDNGWGKRWKIFALEAPVTIGMIRDGAEPTISHSDKVAQHKRYEKDNDGNRLPVGAPIWEGSSILVREPYKSDASHFSSKEDALNQCADMIADGFLTAETTVLANARVERDRELQERRDNAARHEERQRELARLAQEKSDDLDLIAMAFAEMTTEGKVSNFQREALFLAARHLGIKGLE